MVGRALEVEGEASSSSESRTRRLFDFETARNRCQLWNHHVLETNILGRAGSSSAGDLRFVELSATVSTSTRDIRTMF